MNRMFQSFIDHVTFSADEIGLRVAMTDAAQALGMSRFAYLALAEPGRHWPRLISTYPEAWTERYFRRRYDRIDPVVLTAADAVAPFAWDGTGAAAGLSDRQRALFEEASAFDIRCGYTVPVRDSRGQAAALTFVADDHGAAFRRAIDRHGALLHLLAMYFHAHACRLWGACDRPAVARLTARERECLEWASRGKGAWETAQILGLSRRTVVFHLENAKAKLGVRTKLQAVARYIEAARTRG